MGIIVKGGYAYNEDTTLTVVNDVVRFTDGSTAYLLHRSHHNLHLTNAHGNTFVKLRPKTASLHKRWEASYDDESRPIFSVCRSSIIGRGSDLTATVYHNPLAKKFEIIGSFQSRRFTMNEDGSRSEVANIVIKKDGFLLKVKAEFDTAFVVAIVFMLQEIVGVKSPREDMI